MYVCAFVDLNVFICVSLCMSAYVYEAMKVCRGSRTNIRTCMHAIRALINASTASVPSRWRQLRKRLHFLWWICIYIYIYIHTYIHTRSLTSVGHHGGSLDSNGYENGYRSYDELDDSYDMPSQRSVSELSYPDERGGSVRWVSRGLVYMYVFMHDSVRWVFHVLVYMLPRRAVSYLPWKAMCT